MLPSDPAARRIPHHIASQLLRLGYAAPSFPEVELESTSSGSVAVAPTEAFVGTWGTWIVTFTVSDDPIESPGGIRVQLPEAWHAGIRNSAFRVQATASREPNFVSAKATNSEVVLQTFIEMESDAVLDKGGRWSNLSGRSGYYNYVTRVIIRRGRLGPGDSIALTFGDTSGGSRGMRVGLHRSGPSPVLVAVDHAGTGRFRLHTDRPSMTLHPGEPVEIFVAARADAVVGDPTTVKLALVDSEANPAARSAAVIELSVAEGEADLPASATLDVGRGWVEVECIPRAVGILRVRASDPTRRLTAVSNPIRVHEGLPSTQVYWGDLHSHTEVSGDGIGTGAEAHEYARRVVGLDFYSRTDHNSYFEDGATPGDFDAYVRASDDSDAPGEFVALNGYEVSFGSPYGHHNVYFRDRPIQVGDPYSTTLPEIWKALEGRQALTIPHHTLKMPSIVDWAGDENMEQRRNFEIYSAHGLSEEFDPYHPLAIEQSLFTNASFSQRSGTSAQTAWENGLQLSTIAASDDHRSQPGLPHHGLAAVRSTGLTRAEIFDALYERRTYGTTGARILLDFSAGGIEMGGSGAATRPVVVRCSAIGTDVIDSVELLRHQAGLPGFRVIATLRPLDDRFDWDLTDDPGPSAAIYYVRLRQRGLVRGLLAMAWSSPVWIEPAEDRPAGPLPGTQ